MNVHWTDVDARDGGDALLLVFTPEERAELEELGDLEEIVRHGVDGYVWRLRTRARLAERAK